VDEIWRLWNTIDTRWPPIEVLIEHRVTDARTEAAKHRHQADQIRTPANYVVHAVTSGSAFVF
jgi:hypothetical protein